MVADFGPSNIGKSGPAYGVAAAKVYTECYDRIVVESRKVDPVLQFVGPELGPEKWDAEQSTQFIGYFMDPENHEDKKAPQWVSFHYPAGALCGAPAARADSSQLFQKLDCWLTGGVADVETIRQKVAPDAGLFCNEIYDGGKCPSEAAAERIVCDLCHHTCDRG